jgi:hypothetical protein
MLVSEPLHSLNASPRQADCSAADGLKPANAALGNINRARPTAAIIPFRFVFMTFSPDRAFGVGTMSPGQREARDGDNKKPHCHRRNTYKHRVH